MQKRFSLVTSVWIQRKSPIHLELGAGLGYSGYVLGSNMQLYMAFLLSVILSCFKGLDQLSLFKQCDMFCVCSTELPDCLLCAWVFFRHVQCVQTRFTWLFGVWVRGVFYLACLGSDWSAVRWRFSHRGILGVGAAWSPGKYTTRASAPTQRPLSISALFHSISHTALQERIKFISADVIQLWIVIYSAVCIKEWFPNVKLPAA